MENTTTSIFDKKNRTVAALTTVKGYYMAVAGFVNGSTTPYETQKAEIVKDKKKQEKIQKQEESVTRSQTKPKSIQEKPKSLWQKILDFIF